MPAWLTPAVATLGAGIASGLAGYGGAKEAASASKQVAREQMDFQERMSNTAYRRAARDLKKAGLNRILAFGSPASSPVGAMAQIPNFGQAATQGIAAGSGGVASAAGAMVAQGQLDKLIAETDILKQKYGQELVKTEFFQTFGEIFIRAGKEFDALMGAATDPLIVEQWKALPGKLHDTFIEWLIGEIGTGDAYKIVEELEKGPGTIGPGMVPMDPSQFRNKGLMK